jgi:hypothetical protein
VIDSARDLGGGVVDADDGGYVCPDDDGVR